MTPDVVVCGAGVAGLATACALGRRGLSVLVLDKQTEPKPVAKGEVLQPGALAALNEWGVGEFGALRLSSLVIRTPGGDPLMRLDYEPLTSPLLAHDHLTILRALTDSLGPSVTVRRGVVVEDLLHSSGRVTGVRLASGDVPARLVVAADGVSSRLRRAAGIEAQRVEYPHRLLTFELHGVPDVPADFSAFLTDRGLRLRYPLPGGRVRLYAQVTPAELRGTDLRQWCDDLLTSVPALAPLAVPLLDSLRRRQILPVYRFLVSRLGLPGLALVGETAHAVHPMAAQGMNTAIADAHCLAAHVSDTGELDLDGYQTARMPGLTHVARVSDNAARMITDTSWRGRLLGPRIIRRTGANARLRSKITHNLAGLEPRPITVLDRMVQLGLPDPFALARGRETHPD